MATKKPDQIQAAQKALNQTCAKRFELRRKLSGIAASTVLTQAGFSDGDEWTADDEMRSRCLDAISSVIDDLAAELVAANQKHQQQFDELCELRTQQTPAK